MPLASNETTTILCLFHHDSAASSALSDLTKLGVAKTSIQTIVHSASGQEVATKLQALGVPQRDHSHLSQGVKDGGTIVIVTSLAQHVSDVERIFGEHKADKIDEAAKNPMVAPLTAAALPQAATSGETIIPIVEEELEVGKRTVDRGGIRVIRRVVEMPAEQSINLREEHVVVDRHPVDRPATQADFDSQKDRTIELTETAEEAVVSKHAHVVEELVIGKASTEHVEHVHDTVRRTEVEVENLPATSQPVKTT